MYFRDLETSAKAKFEHDERQRRNARERRSDSLTARQRAKAGKNKPAESDAQDA